MKHSAVLMMIVLSTGCGLVIAPIQDVPDGFPQDQVMVMGDSSSSDGSPNDSGTSDAGMVQEDTNQPDSADAGSPDSGTTEDVPVITDSDIPDSGSTDTGSTEDAPDVILPVDAGLPDVPDDVVDPVDTGTPSPDAGSPDSGSSDMGDVVMTTDTGSDSSTADTGGEDVSPDVSMTCPAGTPSTWLYYPCLGGSHCAPPYYLNDGTDDFIMHNCGACGHVCPPGSTRCSSGMCI